MHCPLCHDTGINDFHSDSDREYKQCECCRLVFVPAEYHLSPEEEKKRYDLHHNDPEDQGYREFLRRLFIPVNESLREGDHGLDFGSGPRPVLAEMFREKGFQVDLYDQFYADNREVFNLEYDFITASEVVEHLREPGEDLARIFQILKPGGILGIMTGMLPETGEFGQWHYQRDRTHICFFSPHVFYWLAWHWKASVEFPVENIALFRKSRKN